jgi:NADH-quinone oxidoreductase subunit L
MSATTYAWLVLAFPLAGTLICAFGWRALPGRSAGWIATGAIGASFISAIGALVMLQDHAAEERELTSSLYDYASAAGLEIEVGILVDPLSVFMCLVVSGVSALIHLYSVSYMTSDAGFARYFTYLNFFVFSMLLLVLAGNFALLIVGWAFVGFASYALISFWYRRETATRAGMKAFVINVIGDAGLVLAAFFLFREVGSFDYLEVFEAAPGAFEVNSGLIVAICLLILVGAFAKSAQLPLHTWLPDAMEGPTPVSALIHAATMVTAGVYLIARTHVLFEIAPTAADISAFIGLATLIFAATVALVVTDLKRIIAYSTVSQIGYMVVGVSIGAYAAGMFHLMTHAFFKALLFMAAGSIIAAMAGIQNIDRMRGFRRALPFTGPLLAVGALALAGAPPFSGWLSKDEILVFAAHRGGFYWIFAIGGYIAAAMTAFYAFRITFRVLYGEPSPEARELEQGHLAHGEPANPLTGEREDTDIGFPGPEHHVAEREIPMKAAMGVLGVLATIGGVLQIPGVTHVVEGFLDPAFEGSPFIHDLPSSGAAYLGLLVGALMAAIGIGLAYYCYVAAPGTTTRLRERLRRVHTFLEHKWYFDELYDAVIYRPLLAVGTFSRSVVERFVVDGIVSTTVDAVRGVGLLVRSAQSGFVRAYALLVVGGFAILGLYFLIVSS